MFISLNWIQQYLSTIDQVDAPEVAQKLTNSLAEVEELKLVGFHAKNIITGEILRIERHPKLDKLNICTVNIGSNKNIQIVTGAKNTKIGDKIVVCLPGGKLHDPNDINKFINIEAKDFKGIISEGVFCSLRELGISDKHDDIIHLHSNTINGTNIEEYIKDTILEIENKSLTHRSDCFSHLGISREVACLFNLQITENTLSNPSISNNSLEFEVKIKEPELCPRFTAVSISNVKIQPSPFWIQARLSKININPINNVIDITNYVASDIGQPMHAFDYDLIKGKQITLRKAKDGETITTLDGVKRKLTKDMLILSDKKGPIAIAGIMGGERTAISDKTKNIILVAENLNMYSIRKTSRILGLRSEASVRFEKGLPVNRLDEKLKFAIDMILDLSEGELASNIIDIYPNPQKPTIINFNLNNVSKILGIDISKEEIINILKSLEIKVSGDERIEENILLTTDQSNVITLEIPDFRQDLKIQEDIVEEIARIYGYQKLMPTLPTKTLKPPEKNTIFENKRLIKSLLSAYGLYEIYSYSMIGEKLAKKADYEAQKHCIAIKNPLSPELEYIRNNLSLSLLEKVELNTRQYFDNFSIFEISKVAYSNRDKKTNLPEQPHHLGIAYFSKENLSYKYLKGILEQLIEDLNLNKIHIKRRENKHKMPNIPIKAFHPGQTATIYYDEEIIGILGSTHPLINENFNINGNLALLEINLEKILKDINTDNIIYKTLSQYPPIFRDLSFWVDIHLEVGKLLEKIKKSNIKYLNEVKIQEIYKDPKNKDQKSVTLSFTFQSNDKTLVNKDIEDSMNQLILLLEKEFQAKIRMK